MDSSQRDLQTNEKVFSRLGSFQIVDENQKIFKRIAKREYWLNCNVLYNISMDSSQKALQTNGKRFFEISFSFQIIGRKPKIFKLREYWSKCNVL